MKKLLLTAAAFLTMSATTGASAQVTIGSTADPQPFSILELESNGSRGLRLPQLNSSQQQALTVELTGLTDQAKKDAARGLQIFNTKTKCVETWNGTKWIAACGEPDPWVETTLPVCTGMNVPPVRFAKFNLGADPQYDTPKKQMKYLATVNYTDGSLPAGRATTAYLDATVLGGLFQWGRKWDKTSNDTSYPVSVSGSYLRYTTGNHSASMSNFSLTTDYDTYGQPKEAHAGYYLYDGNGNNIDWLKKDESSSFWQGTLGMAPDRWGNGYPVDHEFYTTDIGAVLYNGKYYQKPVKTVNDPCPPGFRVPTQDEWERIGAYDCNPSTAYGYIRTIFDNIKGSQTGKGLVWVPVRAGIADASGWKTSSIFGTDIGGYAVYDSLEWNPSRRSGGYFDKSGTGTPDMTLSLYADEAPEPLLFLPAAGRRGVSSSELINTGSEGKYWSSTVYGDIAHNLSFGSSNVYPYEYISRLSGQSIRCVVE